LIIHLYGPACDLGVVIDSQPSLSAQVAAVCHSGYYQLRQLVRSMSAKAIKTMFQAFISCRLDYCNKLMSQLVCPECGCTPVLPELHWLPVRCREDFKMATLVYLSLSGMATPYLAANCQLVSDEGRRQLHSATSRMCVVRRIYSNYGDRCFAAAGPKLWNSLPADLRQADIVF